MFATTLTATAVTVVETRHEKLIAAFHFLLFISPDETYHLK